MTILKSGTCHSSVTISSTVYVCNSCGHTELSKTEQSIDRKCPKCGAQMSMVSSSCEEESLPDNTSDLV